MRPPTLTGLFVLGFVAASCAPGTEGATREHRAGIVGDDTHTDDAHTAVVAVMAGSRLCSGTVIARNQAGDGLYVLTAAHCCRQGASAMRIRVGSDATDPTRSLPVSQAHQHPCYNPLSHDYDVCVLEVADEGSLSVTPIPLASTPDGLNAGSAVTFVGYGSTPAANTVRRKVRVALSGVLPLMIATDQSQGGGGVCFGDSGGPALMLQDGREVVAGVSSFGARSALCNETGVAARIASPNIRAAFLDPILAGREPALADRLILRTGTSPGAVRDTYVAGDEPDESFGDDVEIHVGSRGRAQRRALLRFDLSGVPAGAKVLSASIGLHEEDRTAPQAISLHRLTKEWDEESETFRSFGRGGFDPRPVARLGNAGAIADMTDEMSFDVTALARAWLAGEVPNHGVMLLGLGPAETTFLSSEIGRLAERPWMHVCYSLPEE